jgi:hypothetical protein
LPDSREVRPWSGGFYTPTPRGRGPGLTADGNRDHFTPLAHGGVVHAEDAAVFPLGERGGLRVGVGVSGRGVVGEVDEAFAVAAVHFQAQDVEGFAVAVEFPRDLHSGRDDGCGEGGAQGEEVRRHPLECTLAG